MSIVSKFNFNDIEQYIKFINHLNRQYEKTNTNQWVIVKWKLPVMNGYQTTGNSMCVVNEEHCTIFMNWLIENQEFVWEYDTDIQIKSGKDILNELQFYYHTNPITLHQYFMKKKNKYIYNNDINFLKFIENIAKERYEIYKEEPENEYEEEIHKEIVNDEEEQYEEYIEQEDEEYARWENERQILNEYSLEDINKIVNIYQINKK